MRTAVVVVLAGLIGCQHRDESSRAEADPPKQPPPKPAVVRGAAGDEDIRLLLADVASAKACDLIRNQFRGLLAPDNHDLVTGTLWIRDCKITHDGTKVTAELIGNGWQWADQTKKQAGGTFHVHQYVRFDVDVKMHGHIDLAYQPTDHVVSLWFTPVEPPTVEFKPIGDVDPDRAGLWASIVGGFGSLFGKSPEKMARGEATKQGTQQFIEQLGDGMTSTIALCTGLGRFNLGRPPKGEMAPPHVGETMQLPVEVQPGGVVMVGPQKDPNGMTVDVAVSSGTAWVGLVCADYAHNMATGFVAGQQPSAVPILAQTTTSSHAKLRIKAQKCPVVTVARAVGTQPTTLAWKRPPDEIAWSLGGPVLHCGSKPASK
jgi:hypothetical protein